MKLTEIIRQTIKEAILIENYDALQRYYEQGMRILKQDREEIARLRDFDKMINRYTGGDYGIDDVLKLYEMFVKRNIKFKNPEHRNAGYWISTAKKLGSDEMVLSLITIVTNDVLMNLDYKRRQKEEAKKYDIIYKSGNLIAFKPNTTEASCKLGKGTKWCTASTKKRNYFNDYSDDGDLYYIHTRLATPYDKLAVYIHFNIDDYEIFDSSNNDLSIKEFKDILYETGEPTDGLVELTKGIFGKDIISDMRTAENFTSFKEKSGGRSSREMFDSLVSLINAMGFGVFMQERNFSNAFETFGNFVTEHAIGRTFSDWGELIDTGKMVLGTDLHRPLTNTISIARIAHPADADDVNEFVNVFSDFASHLRGDGRNEINFIFGEDSDALFSISQTIISMIQNLPMIKDQLNEDTILILEDAKNLIGDMIYNPLPSIVVKKMVLAANDN